MISLQCPRALHKLGKKNSNNNTNIQIKLKEISNF